ncbi:hypothetical protein NFX46_39330 [Streptomyces phaeoluteigriseus]|uniref:Uncharacterized protein n=1 Tax=Streptomyces phaeoluteigriseus TaxID=114686 RepID=A0ABY4ZJT8_9ACTN|nr:hypothetical protein [Streptomyces phaeoluteigriseus]USQ89261.1 hypothetical protein NFX46_39330 [Streptomyces phaeoluteigriseus]
MTDHVIINAPEGSNPNGWTDGEPLMEAIATAVFEQCTIEPTVGLVVDDPRNIAAVAAAVARRLLTDGHRPAPQAWPTPEQAYADAPSINNEIGWTARTLATAECFTELGREFYLRKAALLDRIALLHEPDTLNSDAETAEAAALHLLDLDQPAIICDPRTYVRQQYARWTTDHQ